MKIQRPKPTNNHIEQINLRKRRSPFLGKLLSNPLFGGRGLLDDIFKPAERIFDDITNDDFGFDISFEFPLPDPIFPFDLIPHRRHHNHHAGGLGGNGDNGKRVPNNIIHTPSSTSSPISENRVYLRNFYDVNIFFFFSFFFRNRTLLNACTFLHVDILLNIINDESKLCRLRMLVQFR